MRYLVFQSFSKVLERCLLPLSRVYVTIHPNHQTIYRPTRQSLYLYSVRKPRGIFKSIRSIIHVLMLKRAL